MVWNNICTTAAIVKPLLSVFTLCIGAVIQFAPHPGERSWREWYARLKKAPFSPPPWVFGVVWPILYALVAAGGILNTYYNEQPGVSIRHTTYQWLEAMYYVQFPLNVVWVLFFFRMRLPVLALIILFITLSCAIALLILSFILKALPGALLSPYVAWLVFALVLNTWIVATPQNLQTPDQAPPPKSKA